MDFFFFLRCLKQEQNTTFNTVTTSKRAIEPKRATSQESKPGLLVMFLGGSEGFTVADSGKASVELVVLWFLPSLRVTLTTAVLFSPLEKPSPMVVLTVGEGIRLGNDDDDGVVEEQGDKFPPVDEV